MLLHNLYHPSTMKMFLLVVILACLPLPSWSRSNLALIFNTTNTTCSAVCSSCNNTLTNEAESATGALLQELLNTTRTNSQAIKATQERMETIVQNLLELQNKSCYSPLPTSCDEIMERQPTAPPGVYQIVMIGETQPQYVYCNMSREETIELCGSVGGWTRLAYLNMNDTTMNCPSGFRLYQSGGVRACGRPTSNVG